MIDQRFYLFYPFIFIVYESLSIHTSKIRNFPVNDEKHCKKVPLAANFTVKVKKQTVMKVKLKI